MGKTTLYSLKILFYPLKCVGFFKNIIIQKCFENISYFFQTVMNSVSRVYRKTIIFIIYVQPPKKELNIIMLVNFVDS